MTAMTWQPLELEVRELKTWCQEHPWVEVNDRLVEQQRELFRLERPDLHADSPAFAEAFAAVDNNDEGRWFYYPWRAVVVRVLSPTNFRRLRSSRNHNLITVEEQAKFETATIGIAGLSVGSSVLHALALTGSYRKLVIADHDTLEVSNLNRIQGSVTDVGLPKTIMAARNVYELDPYANVELYNDGLTSGNVTSFVDGLTVAVCAMDGLDMKVRLRHAARSAKIPVVMATDVENLLLDIEPFHTEPDRPIFHGRVNEADLDRMLAGSLTKPEFIGLAMRIIGLDDLTERLMTSLPEIGRSLVSQPQLGSSAMIAGGIAAQAVHRLILGQPIPAGRLTFGVAERLDADYDHPAAIERRTTLKQRLSGGKAPNQSVDQSDHA